jgi:hypothetical protein
VQVSDVDARIGRGFGLVALRAKAAGQYLDSTARLGIFARCAVNRAF